MSLLALSQTGTFTETPFCIRQLETERPEQAALWLALLFVAQLATGPVLSLMYDKSGGASGTAFGLNCLGLFTGSL